MGIFSKNDTRAPHLLFPEILHWQEGDRIKARNVTVKGVFAMINARETGNYTRIYNYKAITPDGSIIVEDEESREVHKVVLRTFLKKADNLSLRKRDIFSELDSSSEYMTLISEFQKAYQELSDNEDETKLLEG